jgi:hypothetical protein
MARRIHANIIEEYQFLKRRIAKYISNAKRYDKAPLKQSKILVKTRKLIARMLEIEKECKWNGWPHPETFSPDYVPPNSMSMNANQDFRLLTQPDGTLPKNPNKVFNELDSEVAGTFTMDMLKQQAQKMPPMMDPSGELFIPPALDGFVIKGDTEE